MPSMGFYTPCPCRQCSWAQGLPSHLSPACAWLGTLTFPQTQDSLPVLPLLEMGGTTFPENLLATCVPFSGQSPCPDPPPPETFFLLLLGLSYVPSPTQPLVPLHPGSPRVVCPGATLPQGLPERPLRPSSGYTQFRTLQRLPRACKIKLQTLRPAFQVPLPESVCPVLSLTSLSPWKPSAPAQPLAAS